MLNEGEDLATVIPTLGISESTWDRWKNTYGETEPSFDDVGGDVATIVDQHPSCGIRPRCRSPRPFAGDFRVRDGPIQPAVPDPPAAADRRALRASLLGNRLSIRLAACAGVHRVLRLGSRRYSPSVAVRDRQDDRCGAVHRRSDSRADIPGCRRTCQRARTIPQPDATIPVDDLLEDVSVSSDLRTDFLTITFTATDSTVAQVGANVRLGWVLHDRRQRPVDVEEERRDLRGRSQRLDELLESVPGHRY